jgi:hypothetical protein
MPKRPMPLLLLKLMDPPNDVATLSTLGAIPLPLS